MKVRKTSIKYKLFSTKRKRPKSVLIPSVIPNVQHSQDISKNAEMRDTIFREELVDFHISQDTCSSKYSKDIVECSEKWSNVRMDCLEASLDNMIYQHEACSECGDPDGIYRCSDCGQSSLCKQCIDVIHSKVKLHCPQKWNSTVFEDYCTDSLFVFHTGHSKECEKHYEKFFSVVDSQGRFHHRCRFILCCCKEETASFYGMRLWPNNPIDASVLFDISLLRICRSCQMEGNMSLYSFAQSVKWLNKHLWKSESYIYRYLSKYGAFQEFKLLDEMTVNMGEFENYFKCPCCYQNPHQTYVMDGNFAAVHKRSASKFEIARRYDSFFFKEVPLENEVFEAVNEGCLNFRAGAYLRSKESNKKLDVQGVFGAVCRHEFWKFICDMNSGERFSYPVFAIKEILKSVPDSCTVNFVYDVACKLQEYMARREKHILERITLSIDQFHAYGHGTECQIFKTVRGVAKVGLTSGSQMERQWPIIRRTAPQTKEMSLNHRRDFITEIAIHENYKRRINIVKYFQKAKTYAQIVLKESRGKLEKLCHDNEVQSVNQSIIDKWLELEKDSQRVTQNSQRQELLRQLQNLAVERQYILQLIKKYPIGQKVNSRLNRELKRQNKVRQKLSGRLNEMGFNYNDRFFFNPESNVFREIDSQCEGMARIFRIEIIQAWRMKQRAEEETMLLKKECNYAIQFFESLLKQIVCEGERDCRIRAFYYNQSLFYEKTLSELYLFLEKSDNFGDELTSTLNSDSDSDMSNTSDCDDIEDVDQ